MFQPKCQVSGVYVRPYSINERGHQRKVINGLTVCLTYDFFSLNLFTD